MGRRERKRGYPAGLRFSKPPRGELSFPVKETHEGGTRTEMQPAVAEVLEATAGGEVFEAPAGVSSPFP